MFTNYNHSIAELFKQLGLQNTEDAISSFINTNKTHNNVSVDQLGIWNMAQATFLKECIDDDADWAGIVDELNSRLCEI